MKEQGYSTQRGQAAGKVSAAAQLYCLEIRHLGFGLKVLCTERTWRKGHTHGPSREVAVLSPQPKRATCCQQQNVRLRKSQNISTSSADQLGTCHREHAPCNVSVAFPPLPPLLCLWKCHGPLLGTKLFCSSPQVFRASGTWAGDQVQHSP